MVFGNDISYNKFGNVSSEFDNTSIMWITSLGYQFWDEKANIKLKVYDVLDQVINTTTERSHQIAGLTSMRLLTTHGVNGILPGPRAPALQRQ